MPSSDSGRRDGWAEAPARGPLTRRLDAALAPLEADLHARLEPEHAEWLRETTGRERADLMISLALHYDLPGFAAATGLRRDDPPPDVHAMTHGARGLGGSFEGADVIVDALDQIGFVLEPGSLGLDFGCSSGRQVRLMATWWPEVEWLACDPNVPAVRWAEEHLGDLARFFVSEQRPPLALADASVDLAYAISVWSHLNPPTAGLEWFAEMHRLLRPGGLLVLTSQSFGTAAFFSRRRLWAARDIDEAMADLYRQGHHYREIFGPGGDWGVESPDWGMAFVTAEWLLARLTPAWACRLWRSAWVGENQDLVVLERMPSRP